MVEVVAGAALELLHTAISIMGQLRKAFQRKKEVLDVLEKHNIELNNLIALVQTVQDEKDLLTTAVVLELEKLKAIEGRLVDHLERISSRTNGKRHQLAHQLVHGSTEEKQLAILMKELRLAKLELSFRVQVASVGVIRIVNDTVVANAETINRIDNCLKNLFKGGEGLRIAQLLDGCEQDQNGNVHLKKADVEAIECGEGTKKSETTPGLPIICEKVRMIDNNTAVKNSFVLASPIGEDKWEHMGRIHITGNSASDNSAVFGYAIPEASFEIMKYLLDRQERIADKEREAHARASSPKR